LSRSKEFERQIVSGLSKLFIGVVNSFVIINSEYGDVTPIIKNNPNKTALLINKFPFCITIFNNKSIDFHQLLICPNVSCIFNEWRIAVARAEKVRKIPMLILRRGVNQLFIALDPSIMQDEYAYGFTVPQIHLSTILYPTVKVIEKDGKFTMPRITANKRYIIVIFNFDDFILSNLNNGVVIHFKHIYERIKGV